MYFESWQAFWQMGGHSLYVWLSYGVTFVVLLAIVAGLRLRARRLIEELKASPAETARGAVWVEEDASGST